MTGRGGDHDRPSSPMSESLDTAGVQKTAGPGLGVVCELRNPETTWRGAAPVLPRTAGQPSRTLWGESLMPLNQVIIKS